MAGPVRSVSQAFAILHALGAEGGALTLSDIARRVGLSVSSCLNLLRTLQSEGVLTLGPGKRYQLAPDWADLPALKDRDEARLLARARPALTRFARDHDATLGLWRIEPRGRIVLVLLGDSGSAMRIQMLEGQRQPLGAGSTGRALAAAQGLDPAALEQRYAAVRWQNPLSLIDYQDQIALAAQRGFAIDDGFGHAGVCSISAVVPQEPITHCLSASLFSGARSDSELITLGGKLAALGQALAIQGKP